VTVVVQMDRNPNHDTQYGNWDDTRRFVVHQNDEPTANSAVSSLGEIDMADPAALRDFVVWVVDNYPADHYLLSIWNHGAGWRESREAIRAVEANARDTGESALVGAKLVSWDDTSGTGRALYMHEVGEALRQAQEETNVKLDIVGFDACLMGMIEVAYEIKDYADYMIGSEDIEPGDGWPYDKILRGLEHNREKWTPRDLSRWIVRKFVEEYPFNSDVTQAAYELGRIDQVTKRLEDFIRVHSKLTDDEWDMIGEAREAADVYHSGSGYCRWSCWGTDLEAFALYIKANANSKESKNTATYLANVLDGFVAEEKQGSGRSGSHGVAIYFPPNQTAFVNDPEHTGYQSGNQDNPVAFVNDHNWDEWLQSQYFDEFP
jgi:hypothetical protein